jgi:uncharacterized SAM-binding protein YcdF (DUF218 family)
LALTVNRRAFAWLLLPSRNGLCLFLIGGTLLSSLFAAAVLLAPKLLCAEESSAAADAIVVLGGDAARRANAAAELFHRCKAKIIVVSGDGDCHTNQQVLVAANVPLEQIILECESQNTMQNAELSVAILRKHMAGRVIVVTSWWHSRRAMNCFKKVGRELVLYSFPVLNLPQPSLIPSQTSEQLHIVLEYLKTAWYWIKYSVSPFANSTSRALRSDSSSNSVQDYPGRSGEEAFW